MKNKNRIAFFISLILLGEARGAFAAESCKAIPNLAVGLGKVYDQVDTSWCHSFTAADLLTQKLQRLKRLKPGERIHPLAVAAILQLARNNAPDMATGETGTAFNNLRAVKDYSKKYGFKLCKQNEFGSTNIYKNKVSQSGISESMGFFRDMMSTPMKPDPDPLMCKGDSDFDGVIAITKVLDRVQWEEAIKKNCSVAVPPMQYMKSYEPEWSREIADSDHIIANPVREMKIGRTIDEALESGAIAGIDYNPNFMLADDSKIHGTHWSSIIARRTGPSGECEYMIRNSWGTDCGPIMKRENCINGQIWVSRKKLLESTDTVQYIK